MFHRLYYLGIEFFYVVTVISVHVFICFLIVVLLLERLSGLLNKTFKAFMGSIPWSEVFSVWDTFLNLGIFTFFLVQFSFLMFTDTLALCLITVAVTLILFFYPIDGNLLLSGLLRTGFYLMVLSTSNSSISFIYNIIFDSLNRLGDYCFSNTVNDLWGIVPGTTALPENVELSDLDFKELKNSLQPVLSDTEIQSLEAFNHEKIQSLLHKYKEFKLDLETKDCPILFERPEIKETVLLVKQFKQHDQWYCIPNSSCIFDKESLKTWFSNHNTHPNTRDKINDANALYEHCPVRYKYHPFYSSQEDAQSGIVSAELSQQAQYLRSLSRNQNNKENSVQFFSSKGNTVALNSPDDDLENNLNQHNRP